MGWGVGTGPRGSNTGRPFALLPPLCPHSLAKLWACCLCSSASGLSLPVYEDTGCLNPGPDLRAPGFQIPEWPSAGPPEGRAAAWAQKPWMLVGMEWGAG